MIEKAESLVKMRNNNNQNNMRNLTISPFTDCRQKPLLVKMNLL